MFLGSLPRCQPKGCAFARIGTALSADAWGIWFREIPDMVGHVAQYAGIRENSIHDNHWSILARRVWLLALVFMVFCAHENVYSEQKLKNFYLSNYQKDGKQDWEVRGDEAVIDGDVVDINKMDGTYHIKDDTISVKSEKAKLNKANMNVFLKDNVQMENKQGAQFFTDSLHWKRSENKVETEDHIEAKNDSMQIKAKGMVADTQLETVDFGADVEVKLPDKKTKDFTTITCSGPLEIEHAQGKAVFHDDVAVENKTGKLFSDKATIFFDPENKTIIKIISEGNVKIMRDDNVTFAEKATYLGKEEKVILEGRPRLIYFPQDDGGADKLFSEKW